MLKSALKKGVFYRKSVSLEGFIFKDNGFEPYLSGFHFKEPKSSSRSPYLFLPPFKNHHIHAFDLPLLAEELPGGTQGAVSPHGSVKSTYLKNLTKEGLAENALRLMEDMFLRGCTASQITVERGIDGLDAVKSALEVFLDSLPPPLRSAVEMSFLTRPGGDDRDEWELLLSGSDGFGLSAFRDDVDGIYRDIIQTARSRGKRVSVHFSECEREDVELLKRHRPDMVVHLVHSTVEDLKVIKDLGIGAIFTPVANRHFGLIPPVREALHYSLKWNLGSDNGMLSPPDMALNCAETSYLLGGGVRETAEALRAAMGDQKRLLAVFKLPVSVRGAVPSPRLLLSMRFVGYAVEGEGIYFIRNTPRTLPETSSSEPI